MPMADLPLPQALPKPTPLGNTTRHDMWWLQPLLVFLGLGTFIVYGTWAAAQGDNYFVQAVKGDSWLRNYLSPFYSPLLFESARVVARGAHSGHAWFGDWPSWLPSTIFGVLPVTPAFLILWMPGGFRFTCYYYRGAYYKAFWADPLNCGVGEPAFRGKRYRGERKLPLIIQNVHRYFMYIAVAFLVLLAYDAIQGYIFIDDATKKKAFGIGIGSLVLTMNPILLGGYTLGCHSLRHIVGGFLDQFSKRPTQKKVYDCVSCLNRGHMKWAWASLIWVGFSDVYVRLCSLGIWHDWRLL